MTVLPTPEDGRCERCRLITFHPDTLLAEVTGLREALEAIHATAAAGFAEGGTFGDLESIESVARHALRPDALADALNQPGGAA